MASTTARSRTSTRSRPPDPDVGATSPMLADCLDGYRLFLAAGGRSPVTIEKIYLPTLEKFDGFLAERGMPRRVGSIRREHVQSYLVDLGERAGRKGARISPATVSKEHRALAVFWKWLVEEDEITASPMERMKRPLVPPTPRKPLTTEDVEKLLATCAGKTFEDRRDTAMLLFLFDSGMRRGELAGLQVADLDLRAHAITVRPETSKVRQPKIVGFGERTAYHLGRYLRMRAAHKLSFLPDLWLGSRNRGPLTGGAILLMVRRRAREAGIAGVYVHLFRHTFGNVAGGEGGLSESEMMGQAGWKTADMLRSYGAYSANARSAAAAWQKSPVDRLLFRGKK